jgi:DNA-directed RNA polymerase beta subunit
MNTGTASLGKYPVVQHLWVIETPEGGVCGLTAHPSNNLDVSKGFISHQRKPLEGYAHSPISYS